MTRYSRVLLRCSIIPAVLLFAANVGCSSRLALAPPGVDSVSVRGLHIAPSAAQVGSQVRIDLRITNVSNGVAQLEVPLGCPVIVRFYRTGDTAKRPSWDQSFPRPGVECAGGLWTTPLLPGERKVFSSVLPVTDILGDSLPNATYYTTAELDLKFSPRIVVDVGRVRLSRSR